MDSELHAYPDIDSHTKLMNIHHVDDLSQVDIYIGPETTLIEEELPETVTISFQNPFKVSRHGRKGAVENYKSYFYKKFLTDPQFREELKSLYGCLICDNSYPRYTHGQVIVRFVHQMDELPPRQLVQYIEQRLENLNEDLLSPRGRDYKKQGLEKLNQSI